MLPFMNFNIADDLAGQTEGFTTSRLIFGVVTATSATAGWTVLGDFKVNVQAEGVAYTYVPIPNPNPLSGGVRPRAAAVGNTVMLLQFIDGTTVCLGRVA